MIKENLREVETNIVNACKEAKRERSEVTLIAVSKTKPIEMLQEAYEYGCRDFGENKVQELVDKYEKLPKDIKWHMIGHLQSNKVKYIIGKVALIHSVESFKLAQEISKEAAKHNVIQDILIEVNVAEEDTKFGVTTVAALQLIRQISGLENIRIKGLMTIAPYVEEAEENRQFFVKLRQLAVDIERENIDNVTMNILSMGMSGDYQVAAKEGASLIRVGTGIFGERQYQLKQDEVK